MGADVVAETYGWLSYAKADKATHAKTHANAHWSLSHAYAHQGHAHTKTLNFNPYLAK